MTKTTNISKILGGTFSLFLLTSTQASKNFDGFYGGLSAGGDFGRAKTTTRGVAPIPNMRISNDINLSSQGMLGGGFVGYGKLLAGVYLGGELFAEITTSNDKTTNASLDGTNVTTSLSFKKRNAFSIVGRIGKPISHDLLIYLKGGITWPSYRLNSLVNITGGAQANASTTQTKRLTQGVLGLGAEHKIGAFSQGQLRVGVEYEHTFARKMTLDLNSSTFTGNTTFSPSSHAVKARLIWKF